MSRAVTEKAPEPAGAMLPFTFQALTEGGDCIESGQVCLDPEGKPLTLCMDELLDEIDRRHGPRLAERGATRLKVELALSATAGLANPDAWPDPEADGGDARPLLLATGAELLKAYRPDAWAWHDCAGDPIADPLAAIGQAGELSSEFILTAEDGGIVRAFRKADWAAGQNIYQQGGGLDKLIWPAYQLRPLSTANGA